MILVQDLSRVFFLVKSFFILDKNLSKVCPSFVNQILRTSDGIVCPIFVKILSMSKFGLFYYICLFRIQNILLEICMNMSSLTVTLYGWPKLIISVITVIIVISIQLHPRWIDHKWITMWMNSGESRERRKKGGRTDQERGCIYKLMTCTVHMYTGNKVPESQKSSEGQITVSCSGMAVWVVRISEEMIGTIN